MIGPPFRPFFRPKELRQLDHGIALISCQILKFYLSFPLHFCQLTSKGEAMKMDE